MVLRFRVDDSQDDDEVDDEAEEVGNKFDLFWQLYLHFFKKCLYYNQCKVFTYGQIEK